MKLFYKLLIGLLLLFNGIGAIYGGINLMIYPDGSSIQLSPDWIEGTMFKNYFIPGLVLFIANGLFSIFTLITLAFNLKNHNWFVIFQGAILTGWAGRWGRRSLIRRRAWAAEGQSTGRREWESWTANRRVLHLAESLSLRCCSIARSLPR